MSFPDEPRDLKVSFAFGHNDAEDPTGVTFTQVAPGADDDDPGPVLGGIVITRGRIGDAPLVDATQIELALRDTDGDFSPRNATGAHYGHLRNGTPVQVAVDIGAGDVPLATAFVPEWNPTWRGPNIDDQVSIAALGALAFLGRDAEALSTIRRFCDPQISTRVGRLAPRSYWPIDYGANSAAEQAAALAGGVPLTLTYAVGGASWSAADLAPWLGQGLQIDGAMTLTAPTPTGATVTEAVAADVLLRNSLPIDTPAAVGLRLFRAATESGNIFHYLLVGTLSSFSTGLFLYRESSDGTITPFGAGTAEQADALWDNGLRHLRVLAVQNGADVDVSAYVDGALVASGTHSSATLGVPIWHLQMTGSPRAVVGHGVVWAGDAADIPPAADVWQAVQGYPGEAAADRVERVCGEDGIVVDVDTALESAAMGQQSVGSTLAILRDCEAVDHGVLGERRDGRLYYDPNSSRYNRPVDLVLNYGTEEEPGDISDLRQFDDNRDMRNRVTVTRSGGASVTVEETDGPVGTAEIGVRPLAVTLNLHEDSQVGHHAGYLLRAGTVDRPRYLIILDLRANPGLRSSVVALDNGSRIQVVGAPTKHVGPDALDLIVEGERPFLDAADWQVALWCEPYEPWRVQQLADTPPDDDDLDGWWVPDSMVLDSDFVAGTDTTMDVDVTPAISTDAAEMPARLLVSGVLVEVTAVGAPSGSVQALTVTQTPLNGVVKTVSAGAVVEFADPLVWSL